MRFTILFVLLSSPVFADTPAGDYWRGRGVYNAGTGRLLEGLGNYYNSREDARKKYIDNHVHGVRSYFALRDDRAARNARPDFIERQHMKLDNAERMHNLREREQHLIDSGVLPTRRPLQFRDRQGNLYDSYEEWVNCEDKVNYRRELQEWRESRRTQRAFDAIRRDRAFEFERNYRNMSFLQKHRRLVRMRGEALMGDHWVQYWDAVKSNPEFTRKHRENELNKIRAQAERIRK